ncbi:hypothetical protein A2U01_0059216, partial [Trifolium medium]|nr:hypothetical protein [Trifolium medium]
MSGNGAYVSAVTKDAVARANTQMVISYIVQNIRETEFGLPDNI